MPSARRSILLYLNNRRGCLEGSSWCRVLEDVDVVVLVVLVAPVVEAKVVLDARRRA